MTEEEFDSNEIANKSNKLQINSENNFNNVLEEINSIQVELSKINRQLEVIIDNSREKNDGITIGHFSVGVFCICLAVIFF